MASRGTVASLMVQMRVELGQLRTDIKSVEQTFNQGFANIKQSAASFGRDLAGALGIGLGVGALVAFGRSVVDLASRLSDLSKQTGIAASQLMALKPIAENNGASVEEFANSITKLQIQIGQIKDVSDPAYKALQELGINFDEIANARPEQSFKLLADALDQVTDSARRDALAFVFFGRSWVSIKAAMPEIVTILGQTDEALDKQIEQLDKYQDKWNETWNSLMQITASGAGYVIEQLEEITKKLADSKLGDVLKTIMGMKGGNAPLNLEWKPDTTGGFKVNPQTGDFGPSSHTEVPPHRVLTDKASEDKAKSVLESLKKTLAAVQAEQMALTEGAAAAEKWKLEHDVMVELGVTKLAPAFQKIVDAVVKAKAEISDFKFKLEALKNIEADAADKQQLYNKAQEELQQTLEELNTGALTETEQSLAKINDQYAKWVTTILNAKLPLEEQNRRLKEAAELRSQLLSQTGGGIDLSQWNQLRQQVDLSNIFQDDKRRVAELTIEFAKLAESIAIAGHAAGKSQEEIEAMITQAWNGILRQIKDVDTPAKQLGDSIGESITSGIRNTLMGIETGQQTFSEGMKNLLRNIVLEMQFAMLDQSILKPLKAVASGFIEGLAGELDSAANDRLRDWAKDLGKQLNQWLSEAFGGENGVGSWISKGIGMIGSLFGASAGATAETGGLIQAFAKGGPVLSFASGGAVPILAHSGEFVMNRRAVSNVGASVMSRINDSGQLPQSNVVVNTTINGSIIPNDPNARRDEIIQVMVADADNNGAHFRTLHSRSSMLSKG